MFGKLVKSLLGFNRSEGGNVLLVIAIAGAVLVTAIGAAIDMSRTNIVRQNQQNAIDIAQRAANNYCSNNSAATASKTAMKACITAQATKYYNANVVSGLAGSNLGNAPTVTFTSDGSADINSAVSVTSLLVEAAGSAAASSAVTNTSSKTKVDNDGDGKGNSKGDNDNDDNKSVSISSSSTKGSGGTKASRIKTNLSAGASNTAWNGVCDTTTVGSCIVGTPSGENTTSTKTTWTCDGVNGGYPASCNSVNGVCGAATSQVVNSSSLYLCSSGNPSTITNSFTTSSGSQSWSCNGTNGGTNAPCSISTCKLPTPLTVTSACDAANGYSGTGATKTASCDTTLVF